MLDKVRKYIIENRLIENGDKILVALSGGPDSVCLLHILARLRSEFNLKLGAIHINHLLRGEEALEDENYTKDLCRALEVENYIERIDIATIAAKEGQSIELAGREERYKAFNKIKEKFSYDKIAVAHNSNDQAETILMRLMRGSGLDGLTGIKAKREDGIIRPILCLNRNEIEKYCEDYKLNPRIDKSNYEKIYNRNKVRLDILPYMKENFNDDIIDTLNRMAFLLQKDNEYLEEVAEIAYNKYCEEKNDAIIVSKKLFEEEKEAIITRVLKRGFKKISNSHKNFEMKHIVDIIELSKLGTNKEIHLTNGIIVQNVYGDIIFRQRKSKNEKIKDKEIYIKKEELINQFEFDNYKIDMQIINKKNNIEFSNNDLIKFFDYDKIEEGIIVRYRKDGDKMVPIGMKGTKKLKDIFINLKIPKESRDIIPIVCFDEKIAWVVDVKVSEQFKVTSNTKQILKITFKERV
ncbi:tRNA lysidine(34) synthetase TilS [Clostridium sp. NSJ-145]|uniref:tRNA lysidine(34) synthetase TilS n=1 Tax=Clostridium sp. NSJ-145 TaxID=2897777 RepID=UPI001E5E9BFA|nr:tRNA lysidine(34) synthetase TilS [Clostridium sp. NSJ-145]